MTYLKMHINFLLEKITTLYCLREMHLLFVSKAYILIWKAYLVLFSHKMCSRGLSSYSRWLYYPHWDNIG